jgi:hypothetical protein
VAESLPAELLKVQPTGAMVDQAHPRPCFKCAYDLRGLRVDGNCPECGTPVAESLRGIFLHFADKEYIAKITSGVSLILNSILLMVLAMVFGGVALDAGKALELSRTSSHLVPQLLIFAVSVMSCVGYFRFATADPGFVGTGYPDTARKFIRGVAVLQIVLAFVRFVAIMIPRSPQTNADFISAFVMFLAAGVAMTVIGLVVWSVQAIAMMNYVHWLSRRIPDAYLDRWSTTYRWLLPLLATVGILLIIGPLFAIVMYWNLLNRLRQHLRSIRRTGTPARLKGTYTS